MFTGLIEEVGVVKEISNKGDNLRLVITASIIMDDISMGSSIAIDGTCLSVVKYTNKTFEVDVSEETVKKTTIGGFKSGRKVNLERALKVGSRLGGHFVTGHVDGIGKITKFDKAVDGAYLNIKAPEDTIKYMVYKGSVAIDGISLTVANVDSDSITIALIPHTIEMTNLKEKSIGEKVNIECDIIGKYIERFVNLTTDTKHSTLNTDFLKEHGYKI
ncbi:MAG: riboflavin synthase [Nitrospinae bacterium]|nr:riboflavin synthase [Nitrospinota bacterium]